MKKFSALLLACALVAPAGALTVSVDGDALPANPAPILRQGRVMVPMRAVFQALDAKVLYKNSTITATRGSQVVQLRPNSARAVVNGESVTLEAPAMLRSGTTYVPLRFVAQSLGESVAWQSASRTVVIGDGQAVFGAQAPMVSPSAGLNSALKQLVVGNQGGVLKVLSRDKSQTIFYRGLDDRSVAQVSSEDRTKILEALQLGTNLDDLAQSLMSGFQQLPQKEALALLGVVNSADDGTIRRATGQQVRSFLARRMKTDRSVYNRRQAVLALAVGSYVEPEIVAEVTHFYRNSDNLWETFPVQQFFEYQAHRLQQMPNFGSLRTQALAVNSLYRSNIASYLAR